MRLKLISLIFSCMIISAAAADAGWAPKDACSDCHPKIWSQWASSGHPYKLRTAEEAKTAGIPLLEGYTWSDISLVIGGRYKKSRYVDQNGYIITVTGENRDVPGKNQYNLETGRWVDYLPGEKKMYDCGMCHTTGYLKEGHQDSMEGAVGTWKYRGVTCENCHGPGEEHVSSGGDKEKILLDASASLCGRCHIRGEKGKIPASGGFINHHEQFNEQQSIKMQNLDCISCHNPHLSARIGIIKDCAQCHTQQEEAFKGSTMQQVGIECKSCHMPRMVKSAEKFGPYEGDIRTHLFSITINPDAKQFSADGNFANAYITIEYACLSCHKNKDRNWALTQAKGVHTQGK